MAATETRPWQLDIVDQLGDYTDHDEHPVIVVHKPEPSDDPNIEASLLMRCLDKAEADIAAEDYAASVKGEVVVVTLDELWAQYREITGHDAPIASGPGAETGKLFDVPRVGIVVDDSDPTMLKLAFGGSIELDRNEKARVEFYNDLKAGKPRTLTIGVHVAGAKKTHRRDSEGDVDAIVETKSLVITDIHL